VTEPSRPSAHDIYDRVRQDAEDELSRPNSSLVFSGLFAGFTIGATPLAASLAAAALSPGGATSFVAALVYPIGFIAVIVGRAQLFTENTLYPVVLSFHRRSAVVPTLRLWGIVFTTNLVGSVVFALLAVKSGVLDAPTSHELTATGSAAVASFSEVFWRAVIAGWLLALIAWLVESTENAIAQVSVIWFLALIVGLGAFDHCVATTVEVAASWIQGTSGFGDAVGWLATATLGNVLGGVLIVSLLNYGQVRAEE
jgi:formate/nitrite transporter FocA (FNT family)